MHHKKIASLLLVVVATTLTLLVVAAQETPARPAAVAVMKQFSYFVRDRGAWKQLNDDHVAGEHTPVMWVKRVRFEMGSNVAIDRTFAVYEDERCRPMIIIVHSAKLATGTFRTTGFAENGVQLAGTVSSTGDNTSERIVSGQVNTDTTILFREIDDTSSPDVYRTEHYEPDDDGGWEYKDTASWTFDTSLNVCR